jgi:PhnB protein
MAAKKKKAAKKKAGKKAAKKKVDPIPPGYHSVTPTMNQADASATIAFCKKAFGAKLRMSMPGAPGKIMHAEIEMFGSVVMVSDAVQEPARVSSVFLYVPSVDKTIAKAVAAGAKIIMPAQDMFWGDRFGRIVDPAGNFWAIGTHIEDVSPAEVKKRQKAMAKQMGS